jgi:poly-gamma-glutamate synthesis protein (capsule biosynthesis protein)
VVVEGSSVRLAIVGDVVLADSLPHGDEVRRVCSLLQSADVVFGNLEATVSRQGAPVEKLYSLCVDPSCLDELISIGFDVVSVANNHSLDYGHESFLEMVLLLKQKGLIPVGGGQNLQEAWTPVILERKQFKIALLAAASTLPPGFAAGERRAGIAPIHVTETFEINPTLSMEQPGSAPFVHTRPWREDVDNAIEAIAQVRARVDFVVFSIHWGVPPFWRAPCQPELAEYQRSLGRALIEGGADAVVGHHPHSLQPIEIHHGRPIFYSLGNFICDSSLGSEYAPLARNIPHSTFSPAEDQWSESMVLCVELAEDGQVSYEIWPVLLDNKGNPGLLEGGQARAAIERLAAISNPHGASIALADGRGQLLLEPS